MTSFDIHFDIQRKRIRSNLFSCIKNKNAIKSTFSRQSWMSSHSKKYGKITTNQKVAGSNPAGATSVYAALEIFRESLFLSKVFLTSILTPNLMFAYNKNNSLQICREFLFYSFWRICVNQISNTFPSGASGSCI